MLEQYAFLWGTMLLGLVWCFFFFVRKDLRSEIFVTSILFSILGFAEFVFSEYWSPPTLFNLIEKVGFSIEDVVFMFFVGGISSCIFEILMRKKDIRLGRKRHHHHAFIMICCILGSSLLIEHFYPLKTVYTLSFLGVVFGCILTYIRKDLLLDAAISGLFFTCVYSVVILSFLQYVNFYQNFYHTNNLSGIYVLGNPVEEYLFAYTCGFLGSLLYKFFFDKKVVDFK